VDILRQQEQLIIEIMERQGLDFIDALDVARNVMKLDDEMKGAG